MEAGGGWRDKSLGVWRLQEISVCPFDENRSETETDLRPE